jgi:metal-dependent amidase/aminoacylase/carboxypeptidase family protein
MKKAILIGLLLVNIFAKAQNLETKSTKENLIVESIKQETDKIFDKLVKIRRELHTNPELAGNEVNTQKVIKQYLLNLGLKVITDIYGYGLVGILKGAKKGKSIAWRADMDALPNDFPDNVDFKSKVKGVQHGCGHDVHMAIALGIAEVLVKNKKSLKGTVYFIFQPEEESFKGGKGMVEAGLFSKIKPSEIYGLHITPGPVGQIMAKSNEVYAYQKGLRMEFKNSVSKEQLENLYKIIQKALTRSINNSKPWELQQILDPKDGLASPTTIYRDYFFMEERYGLYAKNDKMVIDADVYETEKSKLGDIIPNIKKVIQSEGMEYQLISVSFFKENPTIDNDSRLTSEVINILDQKFGKGTVTLDYGQIPYSNDDFSYFQEKVPGVYFYLGGSNFEKGMIAMIHAPNFMVDEESMRVGVRSFSSLIWERLEEVKTIN